MRTDLAILLAGAVLAAGAGPAAAAPAGDGGPLAERVERAAAGAAGPVWFRYTVDGVLGDRYRDGCRRALRFDDEGEAGWHRAGDDGRDVRPGPAASRALAIHVGWRDGRAEALRADLAGCGDVDAGGVAVRDLGAVGAAESVAYLAAWVDRADGAPGARSRDEALAALAQHDDPSADAALERRARASGHPLRREAVFWLGAARGRAGLDALVRLLDSGEASPDLREHVAFALTLPDLPGAADRLVALARRDPDSGVREQALFWLAQEAGERAIPELVRAVDDDPDRGVKEAAVFSLSRLPAAESVPLLIRLAGSHADPRVREQAFFWLGQSGAPEALDFFERVLDGGG